VFVCTLARYYSYLLSGTFRHSWTMKSNTFFFVPHVGRFAGSTNPNFIFSYIFRNMSAALVPLSYLPRRPSNHLMQLFVQRAFTQIVMPHHEILDLLLRRATVFATSSAAGTLTSNLSLSPTHRAQPLQHLTLSHQCQLQILHQSPYVLLSHTRQIIGNVREQDHVAWFAFPTLLPDTSAWMTRGN